MSEPEYDYEYDEYLDDDDDWERWESDCGLQDNGICLEAGTEHCSFFCPFHRLAE